MNRELIEKKLKDARKELKTEKDFLKKICLYERIIVLNEILIESSEV